MNGIILLFLIVGSLGFVFRHVTKFPFFFLAGISFLFITTVSRNLLARYTGCFVGLGRFYNDRQFLSSKDIDVYGLKDVTALFWISFVTLAAIAIFYFAATGQ